MKSHWVLNPNAQAKPGFAGAPDIHPVVARILFERGYQTLKAAQKFLNPSLNNLESPFAFADMEKAVERIRRAIAGKEKIMIYGDYDVDGITGSSILFPVLRKLGADVEVYIPHRIEEGYGLNPEALAKLLKKKFSLFITVDNGITGVEQIEFLKSNGADVIIVDHHTPKEKLPPADAIVSACAGERKGDPNLAACGLAFKLAWALTGDLNEVKDYLDLVALGTIADIAPVTGDNRILLKQGLPILIQAKRAGIRALIESSRLSKSSISFRDIAFVFGPRINASGRMGSPETAFKLLTTDNSMLARNLAAILEEGNKDRQRVESQTLEEALEIIEQGLFAAEDRVIVVNNEDWHEGVLGIVAARIVERYQKPSIVLSVKNGVGKGSGRSLPKFSLFDCVLSCEELLMSFGGHAQACGLSIKKENIPIFRKRLNETAIQMAPESKAPELEIDAEISLSDVGEALIQDLEKLAPFGPGNKKPLFLTRDLRVKGVPKKRGKDTLQCWVTDRFGQTTCEGVGFRMYERWEKLRQTNGLSLVYHPTLSKFNGIRSLQLELEDWC
ncbi:MAG: single-stranded-DNA-specific exonuclease RecJ [Omnitrophica bacterium RIFCSPHIGHO2_02_FULL_51_18]|nr:MAG: single-stranded-DNA-specific exonuclease RecJ [Omnitrophica bacterium RIFCSPHIGHO2_02_FULL_51_18]